MKKAFNKPAEEFLDLINAIIVSLDSVGLIVSINNKGADILGYNKEEIIGKNWFDTCIPDFWKKKTKEVFKEIVSGKIKSLESYENPIITKSKEEKIILWHNTIIKSQEGEIIGTISSGEDITKQKKQEQEFKVLEKRLKESQQMGKIGNWEWDIKNNKLWWSDELYEIFEVSKNKYLSFDYITSLIDERDKEKNLKIVKEILKKGIGDTIDLRIVTPKKTKRWIRQNIIIEKDESGKPRLAKGTIQDITIIKKAELELKESEDKFKTFFENSPDTIFLMDLNGNITECNKRLFVLTEYDPKEIIGKNLKDIKFMSTKEKLRIIKELEKKKAYNQEPEEYELIKKSGKTIICEIKSRAIKIREETFILGIIRDITERKKAEKESKENEKKYRAIFEGAAEGIITIDLESKKFLSANKKIQEMLGYSNKEILKLGVKEIHPDKDLPLVMEKFKEQMEGKITTAENLPVLRKDRKVIYCDITSNKIAMGNRDIMLGFFKDISERKKAEEKLKESEEKYRSLIETTNTGFVILDTQGKVLDANKEYVRLSGYKELKDILGKSVLEWTAKHHLNKNNEAVKLCAKQGFIKNLQIDYADKTSKKFIPVEINATIITLKDKPVIVTLCRNLTRQKQAEEEMLFKTTLLETQKEASFDGILIIDQKGKVISLNKKFKELWGIPEDLIKTKEDKKLLDFVLSKLKEPKKFIEKVEYLYTHKDEKSLDEVDFKDNRIFERYSAPLKTINEEYLGRVWYFRDITEQKKAEEELKENEKKFRTFVDTASDLMCITDKDGRFTDVNKAMVEKLGYSKKEFFGMHITQILTKEELENEFKPNWEKFKTSGKMDIETTFLTKKRDDILVELKAIAVYEKGRIIGTRAVIHDITERKEAEEELKKKAENLEKFNQFAIGREVKMVELKKEINGLLKQAGKGPKYQE